jgi:hypothetical protein
MIDHTRRSGPQHFGRTKVAAILLAGLAMLLLTGCRVSPTTADAIPSPESSNYYSPLADPSSYADEYGRYADDYGTYGEDSGYPDNPSGYSADPSDDYAARPGGDTNPCAFPGDPLCPDTPITVPPPNLNPPW